MNYELKNVIRRATHNDIPRILELLSQVNDVHAEGRPDKSLYIDDICVDENYRRHGVGKKLYEYVVQFAKEEGCFNITLNVWAKNLSAQAFYESMGMTVQKVCMEKVICVEN